MTADLKDGILLIVDDNPAVLRSLLLFLRSKFCRVLTASEPNRLPGLIESERPDVILLDMNFTAGSVSGREGIGWLRKILSADPEISVVFITAYGGIDLAVEAIREGAVDFVLKPWDNHKLLATLQAALALKRSKQKVRDLRVKSSSLSSEIDREFRFLRGESPPMQEVQSTIAKVAGTDANVLITGENGTGKEVVARELHRNSPRSREVFLSIDLTAIPETLFESELFGHRKGAFTDAREDRAGKFVAASGGTLFLDEIGNLSLPMQSKLLNVLQNREVFPVGSEKPVSFDVRLICATNRDLQQMMKDDLFRTDLFYRINTIQLEVPPLRDRGPDIVLLAMHFLDSYSRKYGKAGLRFTSAALDRMRSHGWPGNVRELRHAVEKAVILSDSEVLGPELMGLQDPGRPAGEEHGRRTMDEYEKDIIGKILRKHRGNISRAASELKLSRQTLYRKIRKFGLQPGTEYSNTGHDL